MYYSDFIGATFFCLAADAGFFLTELTGLISFGGAVSDGDEALSSIGATAELVGVCPDGASGDCGAALTGSFKSFVSEAEDGEAYAIAWLQTL